jgi:hypothetical protein
MAKRTTPTKREQLTGRRARGAKRLNKPTPMERGAIADRAVSDCGFGDIEDRVTFDAESILQEGDTQEFES